LAHIFVTIVPAHTFDARVGEVLTRVKEFRAALAASQLAWLGGRERGPYSYDVNCCSAFFQMSFSDSVCDSFESAVLAMVRSGGNMEKLCVLDEALLEGHLVDLGMWDLTSYALR
jgi:hypothetical protein